MKILAICANKGGTAKTTVTFNLACGLAARGKAVVCVDMDKQRNLTKIFKNTSSNVLVLQANSEELGGIISQGRYADRVVLVDCPPALNKDVARVLNLADYVISPVRPDNFAIDAITRLQESMKACDSRARLLAVPVSGTKNTTISKLVVAQLEKKAAGIPVVSIKDNSKIVEGLFLGKPIFDYKKNPALAGYEELLSIVLEVV